jgi:hypothetical protein
MEKFGKQKTFRFAKFCLNKYSNFSVFFGKNLSFSSSHGEGGGAETSERLRGSETAFGGGKNTEKVSPATSDFFKQNVFIFVPCWLGALLVNLFSPARSTHKTRRKSQCRKKGEKMLIFPASESFPYFMKARKRAKPAGSSHVTSDKVSLKIKIPFKGCYHEDGTAMNIASAPGLLLLIAMTK